MLEMMYVVYAECRSMDARLTANILEMIAQWSGESAHMHFTFSVSQNGCQHRQSSVVPSAEDHGNSNLLRQLLHLAPLNDLLLD